MPLHNDAKNDTALVLLVLIPTSIRTLFIPGVHLGGTNFHDDVIKWKHFPRNWPFVRGIHRSPVNSPHKGQWRGTLMFSLICVWINNWVNNREAGDLRRYRAHYDVIVMFKWCCRGLFYWLFPGQASQAVTSPSAFLPRRGDVLPHWDLRDYISRSRSRSRHVMVHSATAGSVINNLPI